CWWRTRCASRRTCRPCWPRRRSARRPAARRRAARRRAADGAPRRAAPSAVAGRGGPSEEVPMATDLTGKRVAFLVAPKGTEHDELVKPLEAVREAGAEAVLVSSEAGPRSEEHTSELQSREN